VVEVTEETVSLAWLPPEWCGEAGKLHGYQVEFRTSVAEPWESAHDVLLAVTDCKSKSQELMQLLLNSQFPIPNSVTNLDPAESYLFRVLAANPAGYGPPSESTPPIRLVPPPSQRMDDAHHYQSAGFQTASSTLPSTPARPIVSRVEAEGTAAVVEWLPVDVGPSSSSVIVGYLVEYRPVITSAADMQWIPANDHLVPLLEGGPTRLIVPGLRPNGDYEFRVVARNDDGQWTRPSASSGPVRMRPEAPKRVDKPGGETSDGGDASVGMKWDSQLPQTRVPTETGRSGGGLLRTNHW